MTAAVVSGEGVELALAPAGVGSRVIAATVDAALQAVALLVLFLLDVTAAGGTDSAGTAAVLVVEIVLVLAGYPIVSEWLTRGRTLGKAAMGLRVVRDDGGPIGFRQALVRGLAGLVLEKPGLLAPLTTAAGVAVISSSAREKRIGDMLAGTVVLNERSAHPPLAPAPTWVPPPLQPWALAVDLHRLDDRLALRLRQFVTRAHAMTPAAQWSLGEDLRARVLAVLAPPPPIGTPTPVLLQAVLAERRRRAALAPPGMPQQPAPAPSVPPGTPIPPGMPGPPGRPGPAGPPPPSDTGPFAPPR